MSASEIVGLGKDSSYPFSVQFEENPSVLPIDVLSHIFSYITDPRDIAAISTTCREWYMVVIEHKIFEKNASRIGFVPYNSSIGPNLTEVEAANLLGIAFINLSRIRTHAWTLINEIKTKGYCPLPPGITTPIPVSAYLRSLPHSDDPEFAHREVSKFFATVGLPVDEVGRVASRLPPILVQSKTSSYQGVRQENCIQLIGTISSLKRDFNALETPKVINQVALDNLLLTNYLVGITLKDSLENVVGFVSEEIIKHKLNTFISYTNVTLQVFFEDQDENKEILGRNLKMSQIQAKSKKGWRRFF